MSMAHRVNQELSHRKSLHPKTVAYAVRFDDQSSPETRIKFMTDGLLLREFLLDPLLKKYSIVILDEAHERSLRSDVLLGLLKRLMPLRPELKLIIMSATLNSESFSSFFNNAPILSIHGRQHPVDLYYAPKPLDDPLDAALVTLYQIHTQADPGDILVFLPGQEEIEALEKNVLAHQSDLLPHHLKILVCPLFASLPTATQILALNPAPKGTRKFILATNIAETTLTIPGVKYVVDTGLVKVRGFLPQSGMETLKTRPISQANANQRMGRAGREFPGECYRLYTESSFTELDKEMEPEIKRCNLASVMLLLKASGVESLGDFEFLDPPPREAWLSALETCLVLGALDKQGQLTEMGKKMAGFPLDPVFSKVLIESEALLCTETIVRILSMLSVDPVFYSPVDKRQEAYEARKPFINYEGDHLTLLAVFGQFVKISGHQEAKEWCQDHFISYRSMKQIKQIYDQLMDFCRLAKMETKKRECDSQEVVQCLLKGFFRNTAVLQPDGSYKTLIKRQVALLLFC